MPELAKLAPEGDRRMGSNPHANGGLLLKDLVMPDFKRYGLSVAKKGVDYKVSPAAKAALNVFVGDVSKLSPIAYELQGYKYNRALFNPTAQRLGQAIAGEMSLDDALKRIAADIDEQVKAAGK